MSIQNTHHQKPKIKSYTPFKFSSSNTSPIKIQTNRPKVYTSQYITSILSEEKAFYEVTEEISKNIKSTLISFYKSSMPFSIYLRQNKYLIPFKHQTSSSTSIQEFFESINSLNKDLYMQIHNIENDTVYICKEHFENALHDNKGICRQTLPDVQGDSHIINIYYELACLYDNQSNTKTISSCKQTASTNQLLPQSRRFTPNKPYSNRNAVNITFNNSTGLNNSLISNISPVNSVSSTVSNNLSLFKLRQYYPVLDDVPLENNVSISDIVELYDTKKKCFKVKK